MFLGEFLCLLFFHLRACFKSARSRGRGDSDGVSLIRNEAGRQKGKRARKPWSPFIFILPAVCDMTATSCMYIGLTLTHASVFQMLRGSVVIFTGIFSALCGLAVSVSLYFLSPSPSRMCANPLLTPSPPLLPPPPPSLLLLPPPPSPPPPPHPKQACSSSNGSSLASTGPAFSSSSWARSSSA